MSNEWLLIGAMAFMGVITHWAKQIALAQRQNVGMNCLGVKGYWIKHWPETITAVTSTVAGIALLHEMNYITPVAAFGVGYLGNSAADLIGGRVQAMINAAANANLPKQP